MRHCENFSAPACEKGNGVHCYVTVLQKLRLFAGDSGALVPVDRSLEDVMTDEFSVYSGSSLILETVPRHLTSLPDLHIYPVNTA